MNITMYPKDIKNIISNSMNDFMQINTRILMKFTIS